MLPEQQAPLVLTAMTLRGIGSYLRGARLEVRPLKAHKFLWSGKCPRGTRMRLRIAHSTFMDGGRDFEMATVTSLDRFQAQSI